MFSLCRIYPEHFGLGMVSHCSWHENCDVITQRVFSHLRERTRSLRDHPESPPAPDPHAHFWNPFQLRGWLLLGPHGNHYVRVPSQDHNNECITLSNIFIFNSVRPEWIRKFVFTHHVIRCLQTLSNDFVNAEQDYEGNHDAEQDCEGNYDDYDQYTPSKSFQSRTGIAHPQYWLYHHTRPLSLGRSARPGSDHANWW